MAETKERLKLVKEGKTKNGDMWRHFKNDKGWPVLLFTHTRVSFPKFFEPGKNDDGEPDKFQATFLIEKVGQKEMKDVCVQVMNELLKENKAKELEADRKFIRDGDKGDREEYSGYFTISAKSKKRPKLRDEDGDNVEVDSIEDKFVSGHYVDVMFSPYYQDGVKVGKGYGRRINATLMMVRYNEPGEEFAGGGISDDDIDSAYSGGGFDDEDEAETTEAGAADDL